MRILFLGAGKRFSLLESFAKAAKDEAVDLQLMSVESTVQVPIAKLAQIFVGPRFKSPEISSWLMDFVQRYRPDVVIPNMDSATVALAEVAESLEGWGVWPLVSTLELCRAMEDKILAHGWFEDHDVRVPGSIGWPRIFKLRHGFGGKGQVRVNDNSERLHFLARVDHMNYLEQDLISGPEYTVDAYVDRLGNFIAAMSRIRLRVSDGEVEESLSSRHEGILQIVERIFSIPGWIGPLTAQFIDTQAGPVMIEINPRFGGGVTHSIHCGLNFPRWIIREWLNRPLPVAPTWDEGSLMTRCRRDIFL